METSDAGNRESEAVSPDGLQSYLAALAAPNRRAPVHRWAITSTRSGRWSDASVISTRAARHASRGESQR